MYIFYKTCFNFAKIYC